MTTGNRAQRLKYLGLELLKKDATKSTKPEVGLFRGIRTRSDNGNTITLVLIGAKDKENDLKGLNMDVFNVLSMRMLYGDTKELIVFKANNADQEQAAQLLQVALEEFQKEERMVANDPEIIDVKTYDDVPKEFFSPKAKSSTSGVNDTYGYTGGAGMGMGGCVYDQSDWQKKEAERKKQKEKEEKLRWTPTLIKRKGALPGVKVLNAVKKKVAAIAEGEYEYKLKDPDPKDTFVGDEKKVKRGRINGH